MLSSVLKVSNYEYSLRNRHFYATFITTKKTQKVQLIIKLFSITLLYLTLPPMFYWCLPPYTLAVKSNSPYSLINRNFHAISTTPKNLKKSQKLQLTIHLLSDTPLYPTFQLPLPTKIITNPLDQQSPTTHIHREITINISKSSPKPKKSRNKHES